MIVYKYRGGDSQIFNRDLLAVMESYFWASYVASLNDPCETFIDSDSFKEQIRSLISIIKFKDKNEVEASITDVCENLDKLLKHDIGIFSLAQKNNDELLWAHYAYSHKGFCIGYDLNILTKNNSLNKAIPLGVEYSNIIPKVSFSDMQQIRNDLANNSLIKKFAATKSNKWKSEEEIRLITNQPGKFEHDYRAVKEIYFGLRMPDEQKSELMKCLQGRGIKYFQINIKEKTYEFFPLEINDLYPAKNKYLYSISPVTESPIMENQIRAEYKGFIPYLHKAIEITRRDPYCKFVYLADFRFSEDVQKKPEVFVHCEKTNTDFPNYYYTLDEIDKMYSQIDDIK